jgi:hypothetical protein
MDAVAPSSGSRVAYAWLLAVFDGSVAEVGNAANEAAARAEPSQASATAARSMPRPATAREPASAALTTMPPTSHRAAGHTGAVLARQSPIRRTKGPSTNAASVSRRSVKPPLWSMARPAEMAPD